MRHEDEPKIGEVAGWGGNDVESAKEWCAEKIDVGVVWLKSLCFFTRCRHASTR